MRILVGLGNPGPRYARTRHNVGFMAVEEFLARHGVGRTREECGSQVREARWAGETVLVARSQGFMNVSGGAVGDLCTAYEAAPEDLLLAYDDVDLPLGMIRVRARGGPGGHKGIASIIEALRTETIPRVRIGVGRPEEEEETDLTGYVLEEFGPGEIETLGEMVRLAADAAETVLREGVKKAMNRYNRRRKDGP